MALQIKKKHKLCEIRFSFDITYRYSNFINYTPYLFRKNIYFLKKNLNILKYKWRETVMNLRVIKTVRRRQRSARKTISHRVTARIPSTIDTSTLFLSISIIDDPIPTSSNLNLELLLIRNFFYFFIHLLFNFKTAAM